jgi:hypothetical protein
MSRLTISLSDEMHQALKESSARTGRTIGSLIEEGLRLRGIRPMNITKNLVKKARSNSAINEDDALRIALDEVNQSRKR